MLLLQNRECELRDTNQLVTQFSAIGPGVETQGYCPPNPINITTTLHCLELGEPQGNHCPSTCKDRLRNLILRAQYAQGTLLPGSARSPCDSAEWTRHKKHQHSDLRREGDTQH